jgi:hypothetical protein
MKVFFFQIKPEAIISEYKWLLLDVEQAVSIVSI